MMNQEVAMKMAYDHKYDDILYQPHHVSTKHPQMSLADRAAQFSPFAALTGHKEALFETGRLTDARVELDENMKAILDEKLRILLEQANERTDEQPDAVITYFVPDDKKSGGRYMTVQGRIKKVDEYGKWIKMLDGTEIPICDILEIQNV